MDEKTILSVATGRKEILNNVLKTLEDNLNSDSIAQHLLIRGSRGMGKSFFMKYLQIHFKQKPNFSNAEFLLLPEEQTNINTPAELVKLMLNRLNDEAPVNATPMWSEPEDAWQSELNNLKKYIRDKKAKHKNFMLVVVLENLDEFIKNIESDKKKRKIHVSAFRHLLEKVKDLTIIGAVPRIDSDIDSDYNSRLFHAFKKCNLKPWTEEDYLNYFNRRKYVVEKESKKKFSEHENALIQAKLKALSRYTGGSPRMAVVLTNLLLKDDVVSTANTLNGLIDDLTPYYQDLTKSIPKNSKILFDALIRCGENLSQSELAKEVGATQSQISKAFLWLKDNGYVDGKKRSDSPAFSYSIADRIHVLYHKQREIYYDQNFSAIWLLSDFLVAFYQPEELKNHALRHLREDSNQSSQDLVRVYMLANKMMDSEKLLDFNPPDGWEKVIEENEKIKRLFDEIEFFLNEKKEAEFLDDFENVVLNLVHHLEGIGNEEILDNYLFGAISLALQFFTEAHHNASFILFEKIFLFCENVDSSLKVLIGTLICANLLTLEKFEKLIKYLKMLLKFKEKNGDISDQAFYLHNIGYYLEILKDNKESISYYEQALKLGEVENNILDQRKNLEGICRNYKELKNHEEAIKYHKRALKLGEEDVDIIDQIWNLGHIAENHILLNQWDQAIAILKPNFEKNEIIYKEMGYAVIFSEKHHGVAKGFEVGNRLLNVLLEKSTFMNVPLALSNLFAGFLNMKLSNNLFKDLCQEALTLFSEPENQIVLKAAQHTLGFIESGKEEAYLEKLDPDIVIAIRAIVEEGDM